MTRENAPPTAVLRYDDLEVGDRLPPWTRTTDIMHWNRFAAVNDEFLYFHMDDEAGRAALNSPGAFGMGNLRFAYLGNALHAAFGDDVTVQELECQFRSINQKGDVLTVIGTVREKREEEAARLVRIELDVVNDAGESTCPGFAEVAFPVSTSNPARGCADDEAVPDISDWICEAYARAPERRNLVRPPGRVHVRRWSGGTKSPVLLIHGTAAHSGWWDHIGPWLAADRPVAALDLSGHGDTPWRSTPYRLAAWAQEVLAVVEALRDGKAGPVLVGHSMGGLVALTAARLAPSELSGLIVLDVAARRLSSAEQASRAERALRASPVFPTREAAVARFRTLGGSGDRSHPSVRAHIAAESVKQVEGGWTWKVDRKIFMRDPLTVESLRPLELPVRLVRAEHGLLNEATAVLMAERLGPSTKLNIVAGAGHHVMLDEPVGLVHRLRTWLAEWDSPAHS